MRAAGGGGGGGGAFLSTFLILKGHPYSLVSVCIEINAR